MQSNDLNILSTANWNPDDFENPDALLSRIRLSSVQTIGRIVTKDEILSLNEGEMINESATLDLRNVKVPPSKQMLDEVKSKVSYYELLGKSRRWIRRYIKRKFNITEF